MRRYSRTNRAFTLIELLAVIGIIGVLAALLFPAIKLALQKAEISQAQNDVQNIATAVKSFYTEYGKWPNGNGNASDWSWGAFGSSGYGPNHAQGYCENHWLMDTLQASPDSDTTVPPLCGNGGSLSGSTPVNSHGIVFLNIPAKSLKLATDNTGSFDYVDPWGNPYQITVDANYDNRCTNLANTVNSPNALTPVGSGGASGWITNTVAVWSFGPLGPYAPHTAKDWITSW